MMKTCFSIILLMTPTPAARGPFTLELKIRSNAKGPAQVFWSTDKFDQSPSRSITVILSANLL